MAAPVVINCKQCGYANEPERVYCHSCGAKLDRTILPKEAPKKTQETQEKASRRVAKMVNPNRGFFVNWHRSLFSMLFSSVMAAGVVQAVRPPAGVPPNATSDELRDPPALAQDIQGALDSPVPRALEISEPVINQYLAATVKTKENTSDYGKFDRAFVNLDPGVCRITAQVSALGHPLYAAAHYQLSISGNKLLAKNVGGNVGRLPVHPLIMAYTDFAFKQLWDALAREHKLMDEMQSIVVSKGKISLVTRPSLNH